MTTNTKAKKFRSLKDIDKNQLIDIALNEKGTISNCYHLFHNFSSTNAWLLSIQQVDMGLDVSPVMCSTDWVKNGFITEETRKRHYYDRLWARRKGKAPAKDKDGNELKNDKGEVILKTIYPFTKSYLSLNQFKKSELLKDFTPNYTVDFKSALERMGMKEVNFSETNGNIQGYCLPSTQEIAINPVAENAQKTMLHEIAHCILHRNELRVVDSQTLDPSLKEAEAEATAYVCSIMLGDDNEQHLSYSRGYIQHWLRDTKEFKPVNYKRVCKAVDIIMKALANYKDSYTNAEFLKDLKDLEDLSKGQGKGGD